MAWPEISIEDLPPERDDEPSSLRQDILDELSDHFACALNRELLKNPDESTAKQRVLNQFGDPIKIARQLWLDAMKEKIMSQRIMTSISAVMAVCCIAVVGIAWSMMQRSESLNLKMLEQMAAMAERPQSTPTSNVDQQILKQLEQLNERQVGQAGSIADLLSPISFELIQAGEGAKPVSGFTVTLVKRGSQTDTFTVKAVSDETGRLNFKRLPWGQYQLTVTAPWGESLKTRSISTIPGRPYEETIICPSQSPSKVAVTFEVDQTKKADQDDDYLLCDFRSRSNSKPRNTFKMVTPRKIGSLNWYHSHDLTDHAEQGVYLIDIKTNRVIRCPLDKHGMFIDLDPEQLKLKESVSMTEGSYEDPALYLLKKADLSRLSELDQLEYFGVVQLDAPQNMRILATRNAGPRMLVRPFESIKMEPRLQKLLETKYGVVSKKISGVQLPKVLEFDVSKSEPNVWKISIPDLDRVSEKTISVSQSL
ncbi:carboxypeptidase-like regulatory domain-containing protein [uncultured Gimesia sp.]|uniref:carboxypeptidase-like regulatory domain-containing protein n=1 Tax=uncultured Gimesia sp. TaxID=1678688 RepID=UPI0030D9C5FA